MAARLGKRERAERKAQAARAARVKGQVSIRSCLSSFRQDGAGLGRIPDHWHWKDKPGPKRGIIYMP